MYVTYSCKVCDKTESMMGGSTGALRGHLKAHHKDLIIQVNVVSSRQLITFA